MMGVKQSKLCLSAVPYHQTASQPLSTGCEIPKFILITQKEKFHLRI